MKNNEQKIDLDCWPRKQHFQFYQSMSQPNFSICTRLETKALFSYCKENNLSFFNAYLFLTQIAVNQVENFKYRLRDKHVVRCNDIGINAVHLLQDETFRFTYINYQANFARFIEENERAINKAKSEEFLSDTFKTNQDKLNTVYLSVLPWFDFTSFSHADDDSLRNGVPKLVFGKLDKTTYQMPLSIEVHHGLIDGYHVGAFVEKLQSLFNQPEIYCSQSA